MTLFRLIKISIYLHYFYWSWGWPSIFIIWWEWLVFSLIMALLFKSKSYMTGFFLALCFLVHTRIHVGEQEKEIQQFNHYARVEDKLCHVPFWTSHVIMSGNSKYLFSYCRWPKVSKNTYRDKLCWIKMILTSVQE